MESAILMIHPGPLNWTAAATLRLSFACSHRMLLYIDGDVENNRSSVTFSDGFLIIGRRVKSDRVASNCSFPLQPHQELFTVLFFLSKILFLFDQPRNMNFGSFFLIYWGYHESSRFNEFATISLLPYNYSILSSYSLTRLLILLQ